jgi:hypothetical protein
MLLSVYNGRVQVEPTMSRTFRPELRGVLGELPGLLAMGCSPNARQMRCTADRVSPTSATIERIDQCVASFGVDSSVFTITCATCSSPIIRGSARVRLIDQPVRAGLSKRERATCAPSAGAP